MDKGQGQWEKLINLPNEYERNSDIVQRAIAELERKKSKKSWFQRKWKPLAACCASIAFVGFCLAVPYYSGASQQPILSSPSSSSEIDTPPQVVYYDAEQLSYEPISISELTTYLTEKSMSILHFKTGAVMDNKLASITETNELAFITQDTMQIGVGFDKVVLWCVVKENAEFSFYDRYEILNSACSVQNMEIQYDIFENTEMQNRQVLAKFTYNDFDYFLDITTEQDGVEQLELYINMLLEG